MKITRKRLILFVLSLPVLFFLGYQVGYRLQPTLSGWFGG